MERHGCTLAPLGKSGIASILNSTMMSIKQARAWYAVLKVAFLSGGLVLLLAAWFVVPLGLSADGGHWGARRILLVLAGLVLASSSFLLELPRIQVSGVWVKAAQVTRYVTLATVWLAISLGLVELVLQITTVNYPEYTYEQDWELVPVAGSQRVWGTEGYGITRYLSHGEVATPFDDGATSVVVLGDSHTEAWQVSENDKYVSVAEKLVRSKGKSVNLHNLGSASNSVADYVYMAPMVAQYYHPAVVVIQLSTQDRGDDAFTPQHRSYFVIDDMGNLELHHRAVSAADTNPLNWLRLDLYVFGLNRIESIRANLNADDHSARAETDANTAMRTDNWDKQLQVLKRAYAGTRMVLLLLPFFPKIGFDTINFEDSEYSTLLVSAKQSGDFDIIDPKPEFDQLARLGYMPRGFGNTPPGTGHLNVYGHKMVGELLAEKILELVQ